MDRTKRIEITSGLETVSLVIKTGMTVQQVTKTEEKYNNSSSTYEMKTSHVVKIGYDEVAFAAKVAATKCYKRVVGEIAKLEKAQAAEEKDPDRCEEEMKTAAVEVTKELVPLLKEIVPFVRTYTHFLNEVGKVEEEPAAEAS